MSPVRPSPSLCLFLLALTGRTMIAGAAPSSLSHGPQVGALTDSGAKIWARASGVPPQAFSMAVEYGRASELAGTVSSPVVLDETRDFTGVVDLGGLDPGTAYWYRILLDGAVQAGSDGSFRTLPRVGEPSVVRFAFGSCTDHLEMPFPVFQTIDAEAPQFLLHIGDIIYADRAPAATTRAEFEQRYRLNFNEPNWRSTMRRMPTFAMWDDHEIENDWASGQTGLYVEARAAFEEYVARRNPAPRAPGELYYTFAAGEVDFFVLDTRSFRDSQAGTMLGVQQLAELESWLLSSPAKFKLIVSSVQWSFISQKADTWAGFSAERAEIFRFIRDNRIRGVVLLSGDRHWMGVFRHVESLPIVLYELSSSPLGARVGSAPLPDEETLFLDSSGRGFFVVDVDTTRQPGTLVVRVVGESGSELYRLELSEQDLTTVLFSDDFEAGGTDAWTRTIPP